MNAAPPGKVLVSLTANCQVAGQWLCAVQRIDGLGPLMVEDVSVSHDQPGESPGILLGVTTSISFYPCIGGGGAILKQLPRHRLERSRRHKGLMHTAQARR